MKISCCVVSHGQGELVTALIDTFNKYLKIGEIDFEVFLLKNIPEYQDYPFITDLNLKIKENLRPRGFGANHNSIFTQTEPDYFIIINPDIILIEDLNIESFITEMKEQNLDLASPSIFSDDGELDDHYRANVTPINLLKRYLRLERNPKKDWLAGMFLVVRGDVFKELNGFDENFFLYVEDCDFNMRTQRAGHKIGVLDSFRVVHNARRRSRRNFRHLRWHVRSLLYYWIKSYFHKH